MYIHTPYKLCQELIVSKLSCTSDSNKMNQHKQREHQVPSVPKQPVASMIGKHSIITHTRLQFLSAYNSVHRQYSCSYKYPVPVHACTCTCVYMFIHAYTCTHMHRCTYMYMYTLHTDRERERET